MFSPSVIKKPIPTLSKSGYVVKQVETLRELDEVLRLRFSVFNLELGEGLETSYRTGRDEDSFDQVCHHLIAKVEETGEIVGTYRMQTQEMAMQGIGFYSAGEFDFSSFPERVLAQSIELGRACIAPDHRNLALLYLLWKGLLAFLEASEKRYFFGCTSLKSQNAAEGMGVMRFLRENHFLHPEIFVYPHPELACFLGKAIPEGPTIALSHVKSARLLRIYLGLGARICSAPAIDRQFKTIDFLTLFDSVDLDEKAYRFFSDKKGA